MEPLWNINNVCEYLSINRRTFERLACSDPTFPARKIGGQWRCDKELLREWVNAQSSTPTHRNVVEINKPRRGRPTLSGTRPKTKAK